MTVIVTKGVKPQKNGFVQDVCKPASAVLTLKSEATPLASPFSARIRAVLTSPQPQIPAIVVNLIQRQAEFTRKQGAASALEIELAEAIQQAESLAREKGWSQRKLAIKLGLCQRTWRRIKNLSVNPADWLPKIRSAIPRLKPT